MKNTLLILLAMGSCLFSMGNPASALPVFSSRYEVPCAQCHTLAPRLNKFGYAFQANFFNWPSGIALARKAGTRFAPASFLLTTSAARDVTGRQDTAQIRAFEAYFSGGLGGSRGRKGGYFVDLHLDKDPGNLEDAYFSLPIAGNRGQAALTLGQATPLLFQYDAVNSLTDSIPYALTEGGDDFAFSSTTPTIRLDFFDNRGKSSPDGNYATLGLPFHGALSLTRSATIRSAHGIFVHAFHRWGYATLGALGYFHNNTRHAGLAGSLPLSPNVNLMAFAFLAHGEGLDTRHITLDAEYLLLPHLAFTGRVELIGGNQSEIVTVASATYYPFRSSFLRLTAEIRERRADRAAQLFLRLLY